MLCGLGNKGGLSNADANTITEQGKYSVAQAVTNLPIGYFGSLVVITTPYLNGNAECVQLYMTNTNNNDLYSKNIWSRKGVNDGGGDWSWTSWGVASTPPYLSNYSSLSELATALKAIW